MIEVLFGESEAGSMKAAKSTVISGITRGPVSVWMAGRRKAPDRESAGWVPGTAEEVICLGFMLDIGDIKEPVDSIYRRNLIYSIYAQNQWGQADEADMELKRAADSYVEEKQRLERYLEGGETVRIWYSDAPYSRCGFYSLCKMLRKYDNDVYAVKLPEYRVSTGSVTVYQNWGEVAAEEFAGFLSCEKKLSDEELRMYAMEWSELVEDNSPLRAVVNGGVIGVPEDFYDFLIWKELRKEPVKEARLIGNILGHWRLSVGDGWYAGRIEHFIRQGRIKVTEDSEKKYAREICLAYNVDCNCRRYME